MKKFLLLVLLILVGCSAKSYDTLMLDPVHTDKYDSTTNKTIDTISFIFQNNEEFPLSCKLNFLLDNTTSTVTKIGNIGVVLPKQQKNVSISFEMLFGESDIDIKPECVKN